MAERQHGRMEGGLSDVQDVQGIQRKEGAREYRPESDLYGEHSFMDGDLPLVHGAAPGYAVGRTCGGVSPSTGHLSGAEQWYPLTTVGLPSSREDSITCRWKIPL